MCSGPLPQSVDDGFGHENSVVRRRIVHFVRVEVVALPDMERRMLLALEIPPRVNLVLAVREEEEHQAAVPISKYGATVSQPRMSVESKVRLASSRGLDREAGESAASEFALKPYKGTREAPRLIVCERNRS